MTKTNEDNDRKRCWGSGSPLMMRYHDEEWGTPVHDDKILFEFLVLEGFQAGLTWELVLKRREAFREAFDGFDPSKVAKFTDGDVENIINVPGIIRNRAKIRAAINNATRVMDVKKEFGSFDTYIWGFVNGSTIDNRLTSFKGMPSEIEESRKMSKDLKRRGFSFVGLTICYALMQAVGMVNDHLVSCFRYKDIKNMARSSNY